MKWTRRSPWLAVCLPVLTACYTYTVAPIGSVPVGSAVRLHISGAESDSLSRDLSHNEGRVLEGDLLARHGDGDLLLSLPTSLSQEDGSVSRTYQRVVLPRASILDLEVRRLNLWRTGGLVGLAAAIAGYVAISQFTNEHASPGSAKGGGNQ